jgi:hypothetical protein
MPKAFKDLTEQEILALAISSEEDDARIYSDVAEGLRADYPASAAVFDDMRARRWSIGAVCSISTARASASTFR